MPHAFFSRSKNFYSPGGKSLRRAAGLGVGLLSLLTVSAGHAAFAGTVTWNGPSGADWFSNPTYWSNSGYPGATDDAQNNTTNAMTLGQSTTINSFFSNGAFTLQGGTFSGNQANSASTIQVNNVFTDNGGGINNFTINQGTGGSLVFTGSGGNSLSNDIINSSMDLSTNSNAFVHLFNTDTVNGAISLGTSGGGTGIGIDNNVANLVLGSKGSLTGFGSVFQFAGGATLTNGGIVNANSAIGNTLGISTDSFVNTGTAEATNGGLLSLAGNTTTTDSGTFSAVGTGSVVSIAGTLTGSGSNLFTASNGGQIQINGASLLGTINTGASTFLVFNTSGANNLNNTTVNGNLDLATNPNAFVHLYGADTVNGAISLGTSGSGDGIGIDNNVANLVLGSKGSLTGFGSVFQFAGGATLTNGGTVNANSVGNTLGISTDSFVNTGTAEATGGGLLSLAGNTTTTNTGTLAATGGGILNISGTLNSNSGNSINGVGGTVNILGATLLGTINETTGTALVFNTSGANALNNTTINGNLNLATNPNAFVHLFNTDTVNGAISLGTSGSGDGIGIDNNVASLVLGSTGSLTGFGSVFQFAGGATLTNGGTVNANSAGNTLGISTDSFVNTGTAEATNGGLLSLAGNTTTTNSGALNATGAGSVVSIAGTLTGSGSNLFTASNGGQIQINGASLLGTINTSPTTALIFNTSGANHLSNTTINGNLDLSTNPNAFVHLFNTDTVNGAISLGTSGGGTGIGIDNNVANLVLGSKGSLTGFGSVFQFAGGATLTNGGTVNANSVGNTLGISTDSFVNTGTAEATGGGLLSLAGNTTTTNTGTLAATGGGILNISGTLNSNSGNSINGVGGTVNILGATLLGTINETTGTALVFNTSGGNNLNNTTVNGNLDLSTNPNAFVHLINTDTVNGAISLGTSGSGTGIGIDNNVANLVLGSKGSLTGFGSVFQFAGGATLTNGGIVNANSAIGNTLGISTDSFVNTGTAEATNGGILTLAGNTTTTNSGALNATGAGSVVSIAGAFTGTGNNLITAASGGQVQVNGASLLGTINTSPTTALIFNTSGANNLNNTTVNGNLDLATNTNAFVHLFNTDTVNGAISLGTSGSGTGIGIDNNVANLVLGSKGSLTGFGSVFQFAGGATLTNGGTVNANSAGNTLGISTDNFTNTGTTEVQNGATLSVAGNTTTTDSGNILVAQGGTATFANPNLTQTAGLTQVNGTLNASPTLTGGTLSGSGTINGNVTNTGGTVSAGSPFGTLAVNGTFSQASSGTLDVMFSSTQNNLLAATGAVTTGGMLSVLYSGTGPFTAGSAPFTFLDYGSLMTSIPGTGPTQYFSNETFDKNGNGVITGQNGFVYDLINNTTLNALQLTVVTNGAPVPEASTNISLGALLALGGLGLWRAKRRAVRAD